jgi:hypothetical protein
MSRTMQQNFERRFGNPPRINVREARGENESMFEINDRSERIFSAYRQVVDGLLGRPVTDKEIFGMKDFTKEFSDQKRRKG